MTEMGDQSCWIVASTHPHQETVAMDNLRRQGFEVYCPLIRRRIRHARRMQNVLRPLFAGYVFINLNLQQANWRVIHSTVGIRGLIRFGDQFGVLPAEFVGNLKAQEEGGAVPLPRAKESYAAGEIVHVRDGPFEGFLAEVLACNQRDRVQLLMKMLNRSVRIQIAVEQVAPAKTA